MLKLVFWGCVGLAVFYLVVMVLAKIVDVLGEQAAIASQTYLPSMTRDFLLWFADDVLPVVAPYVDFANEVGTKWNGVLTVGGFILTVLGVMIALSSK